MKRVLGFAALALLCVPACGDDSATDGGGGSGGTPISDLTELTCPRPGLLPFVTESKGFADPDNELSAEGNTRSKDESSDTLGVPGGVRLNTYAVEGDVAAPGDPVYQGRKAGTTPSSGLSTYPFPGEATSLWYYDPGAASWSTLGRTTTDDNGGYSILPGAPTATERGRPIYSILEADGSCSEHYDYLMPVGTKIVLTDIDGTLTLSDEELLVQINDEAYVPLQKGAADVLLQTWAQKGYIIVYMSARPHFFRPETRGWLRDQGYPTGPLITANTLVNGPTARTYKAAWVNHIVQDFQWDIVAAYGNADTDIQAYEDAAIPKNITFIIGEFAGTSGTIAIENDDYAAHIASFVDGQPDIGVQP